MSECPVTGQDTEECACYTHTILAMTDELLNKDESVEAYEQILDGLLATISVVIASDPCRYTRAETLSACVDDLPGLVDQAVAEWHDASHEYAAASLEANRLN